MSALLIASFENSRDANAAAKLIKKFRTRVKVVKGEAWEDAWLAKKIDEGLKQSGEIPIEKLLKKLAK